jgi:tRNA(Ile)-lysidine synthase
MHLSERVANYIDHEALLEPGQRLVVGVSGGPDSLCLLDCLIQLDFRPTVAHFDHRLRPESAEEAEFVSELAKSYGVPFELGQGPVSTQRHSVEEAARLYRYRFLTSVAQKAGTQRIAVGHTANDQAETVLMHLIRGAGPSGLRGMLPATDLDSWVGIPEAANLNLIRPLLEVWRHETEKYCLEHDLAALIDPSNQDPQFFRNRLRNELLPELQTYNPRVQEVLLRTAKVMAAEAEAIESLVEAHWTEWVTPAGDGALELNVNAISKAPLALQRAAMRRAILQLAPGVRDVGFEAVERALGSMWEGKRSSLIGGLDLLAIDGNAILRKPEAKIALTGLPQLRSSDPRSCDFPFQVALESGWQIEGEVMEPIGNIPIGADEVWFNNEELASGIIVRAARPGDRFEPFGMSGSVKLSDLFVNRKVPQLARAQWPIVASKEQIIWIPGLQRSKTAKVTDKTRMIVRLRILSPTEGAN